MKPKSKLILALVFITTIILGYIAYFGIGSGHILSYRNIVKGLDLSGGVYVVYEVEESVTPTEDDMASAISMIRNRLDTKGFTEAEVSSEGSRRIRVEIPGIEDAETAVSEIGQTAKLSFVDSEGKVLVEGNQIADAQRVAYNENNATRIVVSLKFDESGKEAFREATANNIGKPILIMLDETIISAPTVNAEIKDGEAVIDGSFTAESASQLAELIRAGALPFKLDVVEMNNVGASLGADSLKTSVFGGAIGIFLVLLFMIVFYKVNGFAANWALLIYIFLDLIILNGLNVTLTLPGIAGIILSIGMAVDANVIIFERIKEELAIGKTLKLSVSNGFSRAFPAILDSNITTLIAGGVLYWLGTGPIKGFAQTLMIGIVISMFTSLFVTRIIVINLVNSGIKDPKLYCAKINDK